MPDPNIDWRGRVITVFGGGGFVGRYVCEALAKTGVRVRVAQRNSKSAYYLQPLAAVGQLDLVGVDFARPETVDRAIDGAWGVINLVGTFTGDLQRIHVDAPKHAATRAAAIGAQSFVHISAIGADADSPAFYSRTKALGEEAVRGAFPGATILRPSLVFGPEDQLTNRFATMASRLPMLPVLSPGTRFQPIYVRDLARAIVEASTHPAAHAGKTLDLGGPEVMTMHELNDSIVRASGQRVELVDLPDFVGEAMSKLGFLPGAPMTRDQWLMLKRDNVVGEGQGGLAAFGIEPTPLGAVAPDWLGRFRKGGRFAAASAMMPTSV